MPVERRFLLKEMERTLSKGRFRHSLSVARFAAKLGKIHGWDPEKAFRAGLLHDCVKEWGPRKLEVYARKKRLKIPGTDFIKAAAPNMFHAYCGAAYAREQDWISDKASLQAISAHTLGNLNMSREDKILFVADYACPDRGRPRLKKIRRIVEKNLHDGFIAAMTSKLKWYLRKGKTVHPYAILVWNRVMGKI